MSGFRRDAGGLIDRSRTLGFTFDGRAFTGHPGDTVVSALLASGERILGRSFKYHRPRGAWGAWFDDPNAVFNISLNGVELPNCPGTTTALQDGMQVRAVNAFPTARRDLKGVLDRLHRFLPAGFYYKMFMWPDWHLFEPAIRRMAGLGALEGGEIEGFQADQVHDSCDLLVVGAGPAGLAAARKAAEAGQDVVLVDDHPQVGGSAFQLEALDGVAPEVWVREQVDAIRRAGARVVSNATAFGVYDHRLVAIVQDRGFGRAPRLIRMRTARCLLAAGALDRPVTFADNDRPGVMSLNGAVEYLARYAVLPGKAITVMAPHAAAGSQVERLQQAGASVEIVAPGKEAAALGGKSLCGLRVNGRVYDCDTILSSAGLMPVVHLWRHAGGKLHWDEDMCCFVPVEGPGWIDAIGAANGTFGLEDAIAEAQAAATGTTAPVRRFNYSAAPPPPQLRSKARQWIDFQHDVTLKDIELAARENLVSVEHLKRYTTLGMAQDQGKTSNVPGLGAMAAIRGKSIPQVGTTTFRPPFVPVPMELYRGAHRGQQFHPVKRLALEPQHRAAGAALGEYGGWLRPGWYGQGNPEELVQTEARTARQTAGIFDGSPLGKIEVMGPDAEAFVNFVYYNTISTLRPGCIRYGFMLTEGGVVYDDGVIARMDRNRFIISCSSSHVDGVNAILEAWRQDGNDPDRVFVHDTTQQWTTVTVTGPKSRDILSGLGLGVDLAVNAFPHMQIREGTFRGAPARIARVSFTGDASYEISVPASLAAELWNATLEEGSKFDATPIGLEALSILRAEKGFLIIGKDTDGETMPHDLGFGVPRQKKKVPFVGDRGLHTHIANKVDRRRLVGLDVPAGAPPLPTGAHVVTGDSSQKISRGYVSSSYFSPNLERPVALAQLDAPLAEVGSTVRVYHLGETREAVVSSPCFLDPQGERLNA